MARINVEDSLDADRRFFKLAVTLGSQELAMGVMVYAWRLAQAHWKNGKRPIPLVEFMEKISHPEAILNSGMAQRIEVEGLDCVYVVGSEEQFGWVFEKKDLQAKGGQKSAQRPRDKKGRLLPSNAQDDPSSSKLSKCHQVDSSSSKLSKSHLTSSHLISSQEELTKISNSVVASPQKSPIASTPEEFIPAILSLREDPELSRPLSTVKDNVLVFWVRRYELSWLKQELSNAIHHHSDNGNAQKFAVTGEWGPRLGRWLRGARNPILRDSGADTASMIEEFEAEFQKNGEVTK